MTCQCPGVVVVVVVSSLTSIVVIVRNTPAVISSLSPPLTQIYHRQEVKF